MNPQIIAFFERVEADPVMKSRVDAKAEETRCAGDIVDIAADAGYAFTIEELLAFLEAIKAQSANDDQDAELNPEELDKVVGGNTMSGWSSSFAKMDWTSMMALTCCGECIEAREASAMPAVATAR